MFSMLISLSLFAAIGSGCSETPAKERGATIPANAKKLSLKDDLYPPRLHSDEWEKPVSLEGPVNTAGAEDSPFITPDGKTLYFFFTPDASIPPERQVNDGVTGIWMSKKNGDSWSEPKKVRLSKNGKDALDGCEFVQGEVMWFCSARKNNFRGIDFYTAKRNGEKWTNVRNAGERLNKELEIGEMHITHDGQEMYFHSSRPDGSGKLDIWSITRKGDGWSEPKNVSVINTKEDEGWPFVSSDGNELWFLRYYQGSPSIWRSKKVSGVWDKPELILSSFAGEPALDDAGNLYFVHHYIRDGKIIEADIFVAYKK
jgi:ribosomal protein L24E